MARILIVDDAVDILDFLSIFLTNQGFEVQTVSSKKDLKINLQLIIPDLILLDVRLNGADGRELCKDIKANNPSRYIPVILLSASPELLKDYKECSADDIIEKPFDIFVVVQKIKKLIETPV